MPVAARAAAAAEAISVGDPAIEIRLRRDGRANRMILRVGREAAPVMTLPPTVPLARARAFALEQEGWLRSQLAKSPAPPPVGPGSVLPFRGGRLELRAGSGRLRLDGEALLVPGPAAQVGRRAAVYLRETALAACVAAAERHAARLGRAPGRVSLRDPRGRWGSCTATGDLMFSWRLILAPEPVLDYVAAHEVAHLVEMNHSPRFWALVACLRPDFAAQRDWLRRHGPGLMRYDFAGSA